MTSLRDAAQSYPEQDREVVSALIQKWLDDHPRSYMAPTAAPEHVPEPRPKHMHAETARVRRECAALMRRVRDAKKGFSDEGQ